MLKPNITIQIPSLDPTIQKAIFLEGLQWGVIVGLVVGVVIARLWQTRG